MKSTIFISHANEDAEIARLIKDHLNLNNPDAFDIFNASDGVSIPPGAIFKQKITEAVKESSLMLVLLTQKSVLRPWIYWESGGAFARALSRHNHHGVQFPCNAATNRYRILHASWAAQGRRSHPPGRGLRWSTGRGCHGTAEHGNITLKEY